jgi:predicted O-methyltransferase YrrM
LSSRTLNLTEPLYDYVLSASLREPPLLKRLREETAKMADAGMQISPEQGQFMGLLIETMEARRVIEVGTFTGYSALCMALALPPDGRVICCDINKDTTAVGRRYWDEAGVAGKIDLRIGPAGDTLNALLKGGEAGRFDFMFIDADKTGYDTYYELGLKLLRPGGLIAIDNVLWGGAVADRKDTTADTKAIRALNEKIRDDARVTASMLPIGDGLTLVRRRR